MDRKLAHGRTSFWLFHRPFIDICLETMRVRRDSSQIGFRAPYMLSRSFGLIAALTCDSKNKCFRPSNGAGGRHPRTGDQCLHCTESLSRKRWNKFHHETSLSREISPESTRASRAEFRAKERRIPQEILSVNTAVINWSGIPARRWCCQPECFQGSIGAVVRDMYLHYNHLNRCFPVRTKENNSHPYKTRSK